MCNWLHPDHEQIPEEGIGWKLFHIGYLGRICSLVKNILYESFCWREYKDNEEGEGFCFFLEKEEAERALIDWETSTKRRNNTVKKIKYKKGLGKQREENFIAEEVYEICLCKEFEIVEKGNV